MVQNKTLRLFRPALVLLLGLLFVGSCIAALLCTTEFAHAATVPQHFYTKVGDGFVVDGKLYQNYQNGYVVYSGETEDANAIEKIVGGKNYSQSAKKETFATTSDTFGAGIDYINRLDATGWTLNYTYTEGDVNYPPTEFTEVGQTQAGMIAAFKAGYNALTGYDAATGTFPDGEKYNPGIWADRPIHYFPGTSVVWIPLFYGDGTGTSAWFVGYTGLNYLSYNTHDQAVYLIANEYVSPWLPQWGEPIGNAGEHTFKVNGVEQTFANCQLFTNGYAVSTDGVATFTETEYPYNYNANDYGDASEEEPVFDPPQAYAEYYGEQTGYYEDASVSGKYYINYQYGSVIATETTGAYVYEYHYGRNFDATGKSTVLSDKAEEIWALQLTGISDDILGNAGGASKEEVVAAFKAAYVAAYEDGIALGHTAADIAADKDTSSLYMDLWNGDDGYVFTTPRQSYLVYNKADQSAYLVSKYMEQWYGVRANFGVPCSNTLGTGTVNVNGQPIAYESGQMFEKGCILTVGGETSSYFGERNEDGSYGVARPSPDQAHAVFYGDVQEYIDYEGGVYVVYQYGYVDAALQSNGSYSYTYYFGRTIDEEGDVTILSADTLMAIPEYINRHIVNSNAASEVAAIVPVEEQAAMLDAFNDAYEAAIERGAVPGWPSNNVYVFNGTIIQNFSHGDGNANGGEAYILYDPNSGKAYAVIETASIWLSQASTYGTAVSGYGSNTFKVNGTEQTVANSQLFINGWLAGETFTQAIYDSENNNYLVIEGRGVPGVYGAMKSFEEKDGAYYINYEHGAAKVEGSKATLYPGRNFNASYEAELIDELDYHIGLIEDVPIAGENAERIRAELIETYTELFNAGYFPGFADSQGYAIWNDAIGLQFFWGDSRCNPFNTLTDARTNVLFMCVSLGATAEEDDCYVVRDRMLDGFVKFYAHPIISQSQLGNPTGHMTVDGRFTYQQFQNWLLICADDNYSSLILTDLSYDEWKAAQEALDDEVESEGGGDITQDSSGSGCGSAVSAAGIVLSLAALSATVAVLILKKKEA